MEIGLIDRMNPCNTHANRSPQSPLDDDRQPEGAGAARRGQPAAAKLITWRGKRHRGAETGDL
jgi:hypothetical protein